MEGPSGGTLALSFSSTVGMWIKDSERDKYGLCPQSLVKKSEVEQVVTRVMHVIRVKNGGVHTLGWRHLLFPLCEVLTILRNVMFLCDLITDLFFRRNYEAF